MSTRPSFLEIYREMAESLAKRSTCWRLQVGTVLVTTDWTRIIGVGYNGNYRGGPNECDSDEPGNCGCIHSEMNALVKADTTQPFIAIITHQPCKMCAKMLVNAGCQCVYYHKTYRLTEGLDILHQAHIPTGKI